MPAAAEGTKRCVAKEATEAPAVLLRALGDARPESGGDPGLALAAADGAGSGAPGCSGCAAALDAAARHAVPGSPSLDARWKGSTKAEAAAGAATGASQATTFHQMPSGECAGRAILGLPCLCKGCSKPATWLGRRRLMQGACFGGAGGPEPYRQACKSSKPWGVTQASGRLLLLRKRCAGPPRSGLQYRGIQTASNQASSRPGRARGA